MKVLEHFLLMIIITFFIKSAAQNIKQTLQLLDDLDPYQKLETSIDNTRTGYGFWFKYIAFKKLLSSHIINEGYDPNVDVKGQLIFISQGDKFEIVLYFMKDFDNNMINLKFMVDSSQEQVFSYQYYDFEGIWIFTAIALDPIENQIEIYLLNEQSFDKFKYYKFQLNIQIPQAVKSSLGGYGKVNDFNLLEFTAKYSEFLIIEIFDKIGDNYEQFYQQIFQNQLFERPEPQEQRVVLVEDQYFDGSYILNKAIFIEGSTLLFQGWVKLKEISQDYGFVLISISYTEIQQTYMYPGDSILIFQYQITPNDPINSQISITQQFNQNPNVYERYIFSGDETTSYYGFPFTYDQFLSWHYIQFQLGNKDIPTTLNIFFPNYFYVFTWAYFKNFQTYYFSNVNAKIIFGGSKNYNSYFYGRASKIEIIHSYKQSKLFQLSCHPTCDGCSGPLDNQCWGCNWLYKRQYLPIKNKCVCQVELIESVDSYDCLPLEQMYQFPVIFKKTQDENDNINCQLGYFEFLNSCYACPFRFEMLNCLDCINNQKEWYKNPICNWDFEQNLFSFIYTYRREEFSDLFLINQPYSIQLCPGCLSFCQSTDSECYMFVGMYHLGQQVFIKCKPNFQFINGACKLNPPFCLLQNSQGICIQCNNQYYFNHIEQNCVLCPKDCQSCHYDELTNTVLCDSCQNKQSALLNGVCINCGLNCKICKADFNFKKQEPFLRCLECIDTQYYYIMFNAVDCLENTIYYCQYAFQYLEYDISITTLDVFFEPRDQDESVRVGCARCIDDFFTYSITTQTCVYTLYQYEMCKSSIFDFDGKYICLILFNQYLPNQIVYQQQTYCPLIDQCFECLKTGEFNQICLTCNIGYYASYTGACIKCPADLNCLRCEQNLKLFNFNYRNKVRAFYKFFVEDSNQSNHYYNDYNQIFNQEEYTVQCIACRQDQELFNGKCIQACPVDCQSCVKINDKNVCQSCPYTYLGQTLSVVDESCLECPTYCSICIKRSQSQVQAINPYYESSSKIYQNICIKGYSQSYIYDQDLQSYQDCSYFSDQNKCYKSMTIDVKIYCKDDFVSNNNFINIKDLFTSNAEVSILSYFENQRLYLFANKNTIKEFIYDFEIVDGLDNSCIIPQQGSFQQRMSKYVFSAIFIKLKFHSLKLIDLQIIENFKLLGFTEIIISNIAFIQSSNLIASITIDSLFKQKSIFQNVQFGNQKKQQQFKIITVNQQLIEFKDTLFINLLLFENNSYFISIQTNFQQSQISINDVRFIQCNFRNTILFNILNENSIKIETQNLIIQDVIFQNSTYFKLSTSNIDNQISMQNLNFKLQVIDSTGFFNFIYFSQTKIKQVSIQNSTLISTILFTLNNFIELDEILMYQMDIQSKSTLFHSIESFVKNPQFVMSQIQFNQIKYQYKNPLIYVEQQDEEVIQIYLFDISIKNSTLTDLELFNEIEISKNKIVLSCNSIIIKNFIIFREEDLPEIAITNSKEVVIDNLQIIQTFRYSLLSFLCLDNLKFQQQYFLITFFQVTNIIISNSIFSNLTLSNQGIVQIIYDQKMNLIQEIEQKTIEIHQVKFERNLILKNLNQDSLGIISINDQNQISINLNGLIFQGNILNEFLEESQVASSLLLVIVAPRGLFQLQNSILEFNIILNSTVSLLYINTKELNITKTLFNNNNVMNYTTIKYFVKDLLSSITSIYSQTGNGYLKISNLIMDNVNLNTSQGFYGGGFQISTQNISSILIKNSQFTNLSNLVDNSLSYGAAIYLEIQSQEIDMKLINISVNQIFTQNLGGFLFIKSSIYQKIQIDFVNSYLQDNYAKQGSIIYFDNSINQNDYLCKLTLKEIIVQQSNYSTYFENLKFYKQNQINDMLIYQRELINIKMCAIELNNSHFLNLIEEGIVKIEQSTNVILANLQVNNANLGNQQLINILSYNDIYLNNIQMLNTKNQYYYKSLKRNCKFVFDDLVDCITLSFVKQQMYQEVCIQVDLIFSSSQQQSTLLQIIQQTTLNKFFFKSLTFMNNQINQLIYVQCLTRQGRVPQIIFDTLFSHQNTCQNSCIILEPINQQQDNQIVSNNIVISNYYCLNNKAQQGGCLSVFQLSIVVSNSNFLNNTATQQGGAIFYQGKSLVLEETQIQFNKAQQGGGIFSNILLPAILSKYTFKSNQAIYFGNDIVEIPSKLAIIVNNMNILFPQSFQQNESIQLDQIQVYNYSLFDGSITNYIYIPSGQQIGQYQYFDQKQNKFINANLTLRVVALNRQNDIMRDLNNSTCTIFNDTNQIFIKTQFNEKSQDFNFDDQIFRFNPYTDQYLLLKIKCDCVKILSHQGTNSNNYQLQFRIKTFPCKIGEIYYDDQCKACDYIQDLYSVTIKSTKCSKRNELTTSQVTSGQLKLRQGFWRYNQNSDDILQCSYSQTKCKGGWETGDDSCESGYVGALCEQCDIYGTRGSEKFQNLFKYSCQTCSSQRYTIFYYIILNMWNILAIGITAFCIKNDFNKLFRVFWFSTISCNKILLHYFQIIFYLTVLQINIPIQLSSIINFLGNPTESISFSLDCVWANYQTTFNIIYIRAIIQIFSPILYLIISTILILLIFKKESETRQHLIYNSLQYCKLYYSPSIFSCLISLISYRKIANQKWILADVTYLFDTIEHFQWIVKFIIPIFLVFLIIFILDFVSIFLRKNQLTLLKTKMMFGYLYLNYKSNYYYWEYCKLVQKFLLVIVFLQFQDQIVWKAIFVVLIIIIYQQLLQIYQPYKASLFNNLESQMQIVCLVTIIFSILIVQSEKYNLLFIEICSYIFLIIINVHFLLQLSKLFLKLNQAQVERLMDKFRSKITTLCPKFKQYKICRIFVQKRQKKSASIRKNFQNLVKQIIQLGKNKGQYQKKQDKGNRISIRYIQQEQDTQQYITITHTNLPQLIDNQRILRTNTEFNQEDDALDTYTANKQSAQKRFQI